MSSHERFEELCAVAAASEISPAHQKELVAHLEDCISCRTIFEELKDVHATWLPEREGFEIKRSFAAELKVRELILQRAAAEGGRFSEEAKLPSFPSTRGARRRRAYSYQLLAVAAAILIVVAGFALRGRPITPRPASTISSTQTALATDHPNPAPEIEQLQEQLRDGELTRTKLESELKGAQTDRQRLEQQLAQAEQHANTLQESNAVAAQEMSVMESQLGATRADESKVAAQLAALKTSTSDAQTELALVETENRDLHDKLDAQTAGVDRERELMADGREIRDLIAARNLHIIDVYDTSGEGQTQKSFGRVFYTEGKSLVFYAYDLPARRPTAKYAFYAWGKRDVSGDVRVRNLGIFYNDDQTQKRWVLKINDPNVLSEIDSVFVTLEKTDTGVENIPTGKKLLSAYLGSPANHP
jgi:hypothetical protein